MVSDYLYLMHKEALRRGLSHKTIKTYTQCIKQFMRFCKKDLRKVTKKDVRKYLDKIVETKKAGNTINVHLNALKFILEQVLGKRVTLRFRYSKTPKRMPVFLTQYEVSKLFSVIKNEKHLLILELLYSAGLRVSEVVNLRKEDFEFSRNIGWVRKGKGSKDRPFIIANVIKKRLEKYIFENCVYESSFVFKGRKGRRLHIRSVQEITKKYSRKADIKKNVHPHTLRHSFATHLIENGYDVVAVQPLLGHNSAETTNVYIHMASPSLISVKSPYDNLKKE